MKNVLLAISSETMGEELIKSLSGLCVPVLCEDGDQALEYLMHTAPDILVLDMALCGLDGATVGMTARKMNPKCQILALVGNTHPYLCSVLEQMAVSYVMRIHCRIDALVGRITDLLMHEDTVPDSRRQAAAILSALGCRMNLESSRITLMAIEVFGENGKCPVTIQLYPQVASLCNGTTAQVEKAIRSCIKSTMRRCDERLWMLYFGTEKNGNLKKPSNKEFLYRITSCICREKESAEEKMEAYKERIG